MLKKLLNLTNTILLLGSCLLFLLTSCQPTANQDIAVTLVTEIIDNEQEAASLNAATPTSSSSNTWTPTATNTPTLQSTQTPLPTETTTPTPWPTLPPDEAADKVLALLADNQDPDCLLPCWWGATPGQTQWQTIEPFLNSFASEIKTNSAAALVYLPLHESIKVPGFDGYIAYSWDELGVIKEISLKSMNIPGYDPQTMMTLYGIPDEVWLKSLSAPREGILPFQLIIVYQQQGISLRYYVDASTDGENVTACFEPGVVELERPDLFPSGPRIYLWEPGQYKTIDEIANIPGEIYSTLEEKTDLTLQTLYEKFINPDERPCIDTPADLWRDY